MSFKRHMLRDGGMERPAQAGDGLAANYNVTTDATDAATTLSIAAIMGGLIIREGLAANRIDTTPTAVLLAAALPGMNVGDTFSFKLANHDTAQTVTIAGGTDVTASGHLVLAALTSVEFVLELTDNTAGAETFNLYGI